MSFQVAGMSGSASSRNHRIPSSLAPGARLEAHGVADRGLTGMMDGMDLETVVVPVVVAVISAAAVVVAAIIGRPQTSSSSPTGQSQIAIGNNNVQSQQQTTINQNYHFRGESNSSDDTWGLIVIVAGLSVIGVALLAWAWRMVGEFMWILPAVLFLGSVIIFWSSLRTCGSFRTRSLLVIGSGLFSAVTVVAFWTFADGFPGVEPLLISEVEEPTDTLRRLSPQGIASYVARALGLAALIVGHWQLIARRNRPGPTVLCAASALMVLGFFAGTIWGQQAIIMAFEGITEGVSNLLS